MAVLLRRDLISTRIHWLAHPPAPTNVETDMIRYTNEELVHKLLTAGTESAFFCDRCSFLVPLSSRLTYAGSDEN